MFLSVDDFAVMPYNIPVDTDSPELLVDFIARNEPYSLRNVLGSALYNDFINGLFVDGDVDDPIPEIDIEQKWKDLRDGANYVIGSPGKEYRYDGVDNFLIPFVYQAWQDYNYRNNSSVGMNVASVENATMIAPGNEIVRAYNHYSKLIGNECEKCDTLYGFLFVNKDVYPNWNFKNPGRKNTFNL